MSFTLSVYALPPGTLDTAFGSNGFRSTNVSTADDEIYAIAIQSDNKIIAVGYSGKPQQFTIARYSTNGNLDTTFGTGGIVQTAFNSSGYARAVAIQTDGKIIVGGEAEGKFALTRYTTSGQLDTTFGNQGKVLTTIGNTSGIQGIAVQSDGKIIAAGYTEKLSDFAVARYTSNGSLDTTFSGDGITTTDFYEDSDRATSVKLQSDGKIVVAGSGSDFDLNYGFAIARYNTDGTLDTNFDTDGKVLTPTGGEARALGFQSDGKIVITGSAGDDIYLARYNTNGSLDTSFDTDGIVTTDVNGNQDSAYMLTIEPGGSILVVGSTISNGNEDIVVAKYLSNGNLDTSFDNGDGIVITSLNTNSDIGYAIGIQPNGGIIVGGSTNDYGAKEFAVARYIGYQPTAANASISGQITRSWGGGLSGAKVSLTNGQGIITYTITSSLGYYSFNDLPVGETYIVTPTSTRYTFAPTSMVISLMDDYNLANFVAN